MDTKIKLKAAAQLMGSMSRKKPTEAQRAASRANGKKGGRPPKKEVKNGENPGV